MLQRQFSQLKTKHFRYPIFPISLNISKMSSHQNTQKTENSLLVGQKRKDVLSASGTQKHLLARLNQKKKEKSDCKFGTGETDRPDQRAVKAPPASPDVEPRGHGE